ncbi:MAG TPA: ABC transporter ATP-binding protein [Gemmatimonadales bacterium]|nr:ABC transporter ATP-binding protein [Gemmatimonadales bacterium]
MQALLALRPYFRRYARSYLVGFLCLLGSNLLATVAPQYVKKGIDAFGAGSAHGVRMAALWLTVLALGSGVLRFGMRQLLNSASRWAETDLRQDLFDHLMRLAAPFYQEHPVGDLMARATNDLLALRMVAGPAVMYLVDTVARTVMIVPMMALISPSLTLWALLPTLGLPVVMVFLGGNVHRRSLAVQDHYGDISAFTQEHFAGVRIVRAYGQEGAETAVFHDLDLGYRARNMALARALGVFNPLLNFLGGLGAVIVLVIGANGVLAGRISVGGFVAFGVYLATLVWPMIALGWAISLLQRGNAAASRIDMLWQTAPAIADPAVVTALPTTSGPREVTFEQVWFRYPGVADRGWVIEDVSFTVKAGAVLGVVGATGSGKSTLLELLARTYDPDRGRILLDGVDIRELRLADLRRAIGVVPQETFLFSDTLRNNVLLGSPDDGRLDDAAEVSRLATALPDLPDGWNTMLGERGINLSGGQRQRAAIARALVRNPSVLVLDDALSAVDAHTESEILAALRDAITGRTALIVSHRFSAVRDADEIVVLEGGRIIERGTHAHLVTANGRYLSLLMRQELEESLEVE